MKLLADAKDGAKVIATLRKGTELVYLGTETDGYVKVQGSGGEGWVGKTLVPK